MYNGEDLKKGNSNGLEAKMGVQLRGITYEGKEKSIPDIPFEKMLSWHTYSLSQSGITVPKTVSNEINDRVCFVINEKWDNNDTITDEIICSNNPDSAFREAEKLQF